MTADAHTTNLATDMRALRSGQHDRDPGNGTGLEEGGTPFVTASQDSQRFAESLRLQRAFALIDNEANRRLVLEYAEQIAQRGGGSR